MSKVSGVTLPLFSVRSRSDWGIGQISDLPLVASWLLRAGQRLVQVLPTQELGGDETSPYGALSAFAIDPVYIAIDRVPDLDRAAIDEALGDDGRRTLERVRAAARVDYSAVRPLKRRVLSAAFARFRQTELANDTARAATFFAFVAKESAWLRDHALYMSLRIAHDGYGWSTWPEAERDRSPAILARVDDATLRAVAHGGADEGAVTSRALEQMYLQWIAHEQWNAAREELRTIGVALMGDMPFIVGNESADVWSRRDQFLTDVGLGAPPDDFSADGQKWGLPAYDWKTMDADGLGWLQRRAEHGARLFDRFRIDHLVGFFRQWVWKDEKHGEFRPSEEPAQRARGEKVLRAILDAAGKGTVIAEDLGVIPPFVRETMKALGLPGYKVLPWERDDKFMPYDPRSFPEVSVATWSTHDTLPITKWWGELEPWERERLAALGKIPADLPAPELEVALLDYLFSAKSELTLVLVNEIIGDKERINMPGTVGPENWSWRLPRPIEDLRDDAALGARFDAIRESVGRHGRL